MYHRPIDDRGYHRTLQRWYTVFHLAHLVTSVHIILKRYHK